MAMTALSRQPLLSNKTTSFQYLHNGISRFFPISNEQTVKIGIPEFLTGVGNGVETHIAKLESEIGDFQKLLLTRTLKLKKLGVPCKHRKLILNYTHKYRLGLWRPVPTM